MVGVVSVRGEDVLLVCAADHVAPHLLPLVELLRRILTPGRVDLHHAVEVAEEEADVGSVDDWVVPTSVHLSVGTLDYQSLLKPGVDILGSREMLNIIFRLLTQ